MRQIEIPESLSRELQILIHQMDYSILFDCKLCQKYPIDHESIAVGHCHYHRWLDLVVNKLINEEIKSILNIDGTKREN